MLICSRRAVARIACLGVAFVSGGALVLPGGASANEPPCHVGNLRLVYQDQLVSGNFTFWRFAMRNVRTIPCELHGYPTARLNDAHGHPITAAGAQVRRQPNLPTPRIVLGHNKLAYFNFAFQRSNTCPTAHPVSFYFVEFEAPSALFYPVSDHPQVRQICPDTAHVSPFRAHLHS